MTLTNTPATNTHRRPWWRLHLSTYVVVFLVLIVLVLANVPGNWEREEGLSINNDFCDHGWPWTYLHRVGKRWPHELSVWALWSDVKEFRLPGLLGNLVVATGFAAGVAATFEWWRRQRAGLWQFHVRDMLGLTVVVALLFAWSMMRLERCRDGRRLSAHPGVGCEHEPWVPHWIRILYEHYRPPVFERFQEFTYLDDVVEVHTPTDDTEFPAPEWLKWLPSQKRLRALSLIGSGQSGHPSDADLAILRELPGLESLALDCSAVSAEGMAPIGGLSRLRKLSLYGLCTSDLPNPDPASEAALSHLRGLKNLRELEIYGAGLTDASLSNLSGLENLRKLYLSDSTITDDALRHLADLPNLEHLVLDKTRVTGEGFKHLRSLPKLERLSFRECPIENDHLIHLRDLGLKSTLFLDEMPITDEGLGYVCQGNHFTGLRVRDTEMTDEGLRHVGQLTRLTFLYMGRTRVTDDGLKHLATLKQLDNLSLDGTNVSDAGVDQLTALPKLERLALNNTQVTGRGLHRLPNLMYLNLSGSQVDDEGLRDIVRLNNLRILTLQETCVTDAGLEHLKGLPGRPQINLIGTQVTPEGVAQFKAARPELLNVHGP